MKLHSLLIGTALTSSLLVAAGTFPVVADTIDLGGYTGTVHLNFNNYESFLTPSGQIGTTPQVGDTNFGIFSVLSITGTENTGDGVKSVTLYSEPGTAGGSNYYLAGVFSGIHVTSTAAGTAAHTITTNNTGGVFQLYAISTALYKGDEGLQGYANAGCTIGSLCYDGITNVGTPVLTMTLTPGVDAGVTLTATVNTTDNPPTGSANFEGIISGTTQFGTLAIGEDSFCPNDALTCSTEDGSTFALASQDPITATATAVPEPASLALFGAGLLGFGWFSWRRRKSA